MKFYFMYRSSIVGSNFEASSNTFDRILSCRAPLCGRISFYRAAFFDRISSSNTFDRISFYRATVFGLNFNLSKQQFWSNLKLSSNMFDRISSYRATFLIEYQSVKSFSVRKLNWSKALSPNIRPPNPHFWSNFILSNSHFLIEFHFIELAFLIEFHFIELVFLFEFHFIELAFLIEFRTDYVCVLLIHCV
jgi:hypothetical protein